MKKSIKYSVVIILISILIYYFLQHSNTAKPLINQVSLVEQTVISPEVTTSIAPKINLKTPEIDSYNSTNGNKQYIDGDDPEVSYLIAYREFKQFRNCLMVYHNSKNGVDLISAYIEGYGRYNDPSLKPSEIQIQYYQIHIDGCKSLLLSDKESMQKARNRLNKRINETPPETKEEIALSQALIIQERISDLSSKISDEKTGQIHLTDAQIKDNYKKNDALNNELMIIIDRSNGSPTEADRLLMLKLFKEMDALDAVRDFEPNHEEIAFLQNELKSVAFELKDFFKNNQTPDIFLIFADNLLNEKMGKFFFTDDLNNKLGIYDTDYINDLNKIIVPFVACSLGYPCGPESYLSIKHCIQPSGFEPAACGKAIEDYYLDNLIGPNQMIDFENYFNYVLDIYAQN